VSSFNDCSDKNSFVETLSSSTIFLKSKKSKI